MPIKPNSLGPRSLARTKVAIKKISNDEQVVDFHVKSKPGGHYVFEQRQTCLGISSLEGYHS